MVRRLLDHSADVNGPDSMPGSEPRCTWRPTGATSGSKSSNCYSSAGADVNLQNGWGEVPLQTGTASPFDFRDQFKVMKLILDHGAEVDSQDDHACTPLHHSSWWQKQGRAPTNGSVEDSHMLTEHGANIHAVNSDGITPL